MEYIPTIGLEIHCELNTASKMFCSCPNNPEEKEPNKNTCPVCMGHPGTLPTANIDAITKVRLVGLAIHSHIAEYSKFDRKNYFYPDLPKGYQISQYDQPLCLGGYLEIGQEGSQTNPKKTIGITRVHMEEDTAKLMHPDGTDYSLVDYNRSSVPLMELVTEPDIASALEAREFAQELQLILRYLNASDADLEKGKMRVEVNISLSPKNNSGKKVLGTKVEVKNLNSLKAVEGSVAYEIKRQTELLEAGQKVTQETRGWDDVKFITFSQREKEEAFDYRYFPEPDIPPLEITASQIKKLQTLIPELPQSKRKRFISQYGFDPKTAEIFIGNRAFGNYFEKVMTELEEWVNEEEHQDNQPESVTLAMAKLAANYLTTDVQGLLKGAEFDDQTFKITPENFAEFICLIYKKEISSKIAKLVLPEMVVSGQDPTEIIKQKELGQINDAAQIDQMINQVLEKNPKAIQDYKNGKGNAFQFLVGQILGIARGRANPDIVKETLLRQLAKK